MVSLSTTVCLFLPGQVDAESGLLISVGYVSGGAQGILVPSHWISYGGF